MSDVNTGEALREDIAEARKQISLELSFKQVVFQLSPQQFSSLLDETAVAFTQRVLAIYDAQRSTKAAAIGGLDPIEAKGVSIGMGFRA